MRKYAQFALYIFAALSASAQGVGGAFGFGGQTGIGGTSGNSSGTFAIVQHTPAAGCSFTSVASPTCAFTSNVTAGNAIIVCAPIVSSLTISSVTDSLSQTYTQSTNSPQTLAGTVYGACYYFLNTAGGADTITVNTSGANSNPGNIFLIEISGVAHTSAEDTSNGSTNGGASTTTPTAGNITTTNGNDILIGFLGMTGTSGTISASGSYAIIDSATSGRSGGTEFETQTSTGTYTDGWTLGTTNTAVNILMAFKHS